VEYLQVDIDQLDQNAAVNKRGGIIGTFTPVIDQVDNTAPLQPYSEVFGLARFRECELIHGRWAMLGALGVLISELDTGISWQDAIAVEYAHPSWFGLDVPFGINQLAVANSVLMGGVEVFRSQELDTEKRCYPGGAFDPFKLASNGDEVQAFRLKEAEMKHCRLAMLACLGFGIQALIKGTGALASLEAAF
jgi:light-harvesting complex II chlorophyll a/b binding protein 4